MYDQDIPFGILEGKTISKVVVEDNEEVVTFTLNDGTQYRMFHFQDCCEAVWLAEVIGDWKDIIGEKILEAEKITNREEQPPKGAYADVSWTWTFYKLRTIKGHLTLRWFGSSNGYYSEAVDFIPLNEDTVLPL